jgi:hypothetical protein
LLPDRQALFLPGDMRIPPAPEYSRIPKPVQKRRKQGIPAAAGGTARTACVCAKSSADAGWALSVLPLPRDTRNVTVVLFASLLYDKEVDLSTSVLQNLPKFTECSNTAIEKKRTGQRYTVSVE